MSYIVTRHGRWPGFPYHVWRGVRYPDVESVNICQTMWGARRLIRKDREEQARRDPNGYAPTVYRVAAVADLPDLRLSELAP